MYSICTPQSSGPISVGSLFCLLRMPENNVSSELEREEIPACAGEDSLGYIEPP